MFSATMLGYEITELQFFYLFGEKACILTFALMSEELRNYKEMLFEISRSYEYHP